MSSIFYQNLELKQMKNFIHTQNPNPNQKLYTSVVKVYCYHTDPNFCQPWQMLRQGSSTGSGFIIEGRRIMTNAHCVAYQNRVLVRKHGEATKYTARVIAVSHECDLALLAVDSDDFWKADLPFLKFGTLPELHDSVVVVGYPSGGDNLSITAGVISRLDVHTYAHSGFQLLCAQIDAAINPGNSGGPAFKFPEGTVVGVAFQGYGDAQNIGYIVPTTVIKHFLYDVQENSKYTGFVTLGVQYQTLENEALRRYYGLDNPEISAALPKDQTPSGILIRQVDCTRNITSDTNDFSSKFYKFETDSSSSSLSNIMKDNNIKRIATEAHGLQQHDVLISLNGVDIANDGTIRLRGLERVHLSNIFSEFMTGQSIRGIILRNKKLLNVTVLLYPPKYLLPEHEWDTMPRYFIYGGLVFCPLTVAYLRDEFGKKFYERAPSHLMIHMVKFADRFDDEIVILSQVLASDLTVGYEHRNVQLIRVNGIPVKNLRQIVKILIQTKDEPFVNFELDGEVRMILDRKETKEKSSQILQQHAITQPYSQDMQDLAESILEAI